MRRPAAAALALAGAAALVDRLGRRSGVTDAETERELPGDELVPEPGWVSTRATTIAAPPEDVWPWIVQMGFPKYRAGWYTPYVLDRFQWGIEERSATEIRPDLQELAVGDRVPDSADWSAYFEVERVEPGRALVLRSTRHLIRPVTAIDFSWAFVLEGLADGHTRLFMRARVAYEPRSAWPFVWLAIGLGDFLNASLMLRGIRERAEGAGFRPSTSPNESPTITGKHEASSH